MADFKIGFCKMTTDPSTFYNCSFPKKKGVAQHVLSNPFYFVLLTSPTTSFSPLSIA